MPPIMRGRGLTTSEQYLAQLADKTFLNLWSYPNLYRDMGKELCDLLVVCGDHILIFSDKTIAWPSGEDVTLAWSRWYKRAIKKSVDQVRGTALWITQCPERIFLDSRCTQPLPIPLPPPERRKVTGIVVALGAGQACRAYFGEGTGSLVIAPALTGNTGDQRLGRTTLAYPPFTIGDVNPGGHFIHVFDDATLAVVMHELDTVTDFTMYLEKKAAFVRSGRLIGAHGEEDLLAYYMQHMNEHDEHDFTHPEGRPWEENDYVTFGGGVYEEMLTHPQYLAKKKADEVSYIWDRLIETFTNHMLAGTTMVPDGSPPFVLADHERAVRYMAMEPRVQRRMHGLAILGALERGKQAPCFTRAMVPGPDERFRETGFFFMTFAYPEHLHLARGYQQYRQARVNTLQAYAMGLMNKYRYLKRIIGIASEPLPKATDRRESSEDMLILEIPEWTLDLEQEALRLCQEFGIVQQGRYQERNIHSREYPDLPNTGSNC